MIRKATKNDFDFMFGLYMHPAINPFLLYEMMDKQTFQPIYNDLLQKEILYVYSDGEGDAGMFKLVPQLFRNSDNVYLGGLAIHPDFAGKGYGNKMLQEIIAFAKQSGFLRIELTVADFNEKAIKLYEKSGFEKEGILKKYTHLKSENRYIDEVMMAYLF